MCENSSELIQSVDCEGKFMYVNRSWKETLGYTDQELSQLNIFDIIEESSLAHCRAEFTRVMQGGEIDNVYVLFKAKDGRTVELEGNVSCRFENGKPAFTRGIYRNVTAKRQTLRLMQNELELAAQVQRHMLPSNLPALNGVKVSWKFRPSDFVAGDMFNVFLINDKQIGFYILDVMGHGVQAALKSVAINNLLKPSLNVKNDGSLYLPAQIINYINKLYTREFDDGSFVTIFCAVLNVENLELSYCRAGHCPPVLVSQDKKIFELTAGGPAIGLSEKACYSTDNMQLKAGDRLYLYTDGIPEACDNHQNQYSRQRFIDFLIQNNEEDISILTNQAIYQVLKFTGNEQIKDDLTLMAIEIPK